MTPTTGKRLTLFLAKKFYIFHRIFYALRTLVRSRSIWGFRKWINFWFGKKECKIVEVDGFSFLIPGRSLITRLVEVDIIIGNILDRSYLPRDFRFKDGSTLIDIGGHIGSFSIFAFRQAKGIRVFSFEPEPQNHRLLVENIQKNKAVGVVAFNQAVASETGMRKLHISRSNMAGHSLTRMTEESIDVRCVSLEDIFKTNAIDRCDFLKMDCEGAEYDILLRCPIPILEKIEVISMEYHTPAYFDILDSHQMSQLVDYLEQAGFSVSSQKLSYQAGYLWAHRKKA